MAEQECGKLQIKVDNKAPMTKEEVIALIKASKFLEKVRFEKIMVTRLAEAKPT